MSARLTDPWFSAEFYGSVREAPEERSFRHQGGAIEGAQGLLLWCPCGFHDPKYRGPEAGRPHLVIVPFSNPRNAPSLPPEHGPTNSNGGPRPRWTMSGTGLADLTVSPSVLVGTPGKDECWHGWIQNGVVS